MTVRGFVIGDFNDICNQAEKSGGLDFLASSSHNLDVELNNLELIDLGFTGNNFTWNN